MPINLGTRSRANIRFGPATVYIAPGNTIAALGSYGEDINLTGFNALLANFSTLGTLVKNPEITTDPQTVDQLDSQGNFFQIQLLSEIKAKIQVAEVDNEIANELITRAEARTKTDVLWVRSQALGDYIHFLINVPLMVAVKKASAWDEIEMLEITVVGQTNNIKNILGQKKLIA